MMQQTPRDISGIQIMTTIAIIAGTCIAMFNYMIIPFGSDAFRLSLKLCLGLLTGLSIYQIILFAIVRFEEISMGRNKEEYTVIIEDGVIISVFKGTSLFECPDKQLLNDMQLENATREHSYRWYSLVEAKGFDKIALGKRISEIL